MSQECFCVEQGPGQLDGPYPYQLGKACAEVLATRLGLKYKTPLCVGVVGVPLVPHKPGLRSRPTASALQGFLRGVYYPHRACKRFINK